MPAKQVDPTMYLTNIRKLRGIRLHEHVTVHDIFFWYGENIKSKFLCLVAFVHTHVTDT